MAKLHGRVHGLPHRALRPVAAALFALSLTATAHAQPQPARAAVPTVPAVPTAPRDESVGRSERELDGMLAGLADGTPESRRRAADALIASMDPDDIPAVQTRLLAPLRGIALDQLRIKMVRAVTTATANRPNADYDLLTLLVNLPRAHDTDVAIERIALARGIGRLPDARAGRALLAFSASFSGAFRQEVGRIIRGQLKDYVLPAIIEARGLSEMQRIFVRQLRESLHRVTPGETVQQRDNALLAEILRAYGSTRQGDAMKVVVSFVNSDRAQVRDAARWAIAQYGRDTIHALRDAYEMYEGRDPDLSWNWERLARELYQANDRRRDAEVSQRLDQGITAGRAHDVDAMLGHFRFVLARHPTFERRREMVPLLIENAQRLESSDAAKADRLWRLALWVDPTGPSSRQIRAEVLFLEAERAMQRGVADPELYRAVLRVDPSHERAIEQLERVEQSGVLAARRRIRLAGAAGLLALAGATLFLLVRTVAKRPKVRKKGKKKRAKGATASTLPATAQGATVTAQGATVTAQGATATVKPSGTATVKPSATDTATDSAASPTDGSASLHG